MPDMRNNNDWQRLATPLGVIRLVLLVDWDPIGIFGVTEAMDEYDRYAVPVYDLLCAGASSHQIAKHLRAIEIEQMGLRGRDNLDAVADKLRQVYEMSGDEA